LGVKELLASSALIDLFPRWHGERFPLYAFHPSRKHPPLRIFVSRFLASYDRGSGRRSQQIGSKPAHDAFQAFAQ
jgi:hypothetical protein